MLCLVAAPIFSRVGYRVDDGDGEAYGDKGLGCGKLGHDGAWHRQHDGEAWKVPFSFQQSFRPPSPSCPSLYLCPSTSSCRLSLSSSSFYLCPSYRPLAFRCPLASYDRQLVAPLVWQDRRQRVCDDGRVWG